MLERTQTFSGSVRYFLMFDSTMFAFRSSKFGLLGHVLRKFDVRSWVMKPSSEGSKFDQYKFLLFKARYFWVRSTTKTMYTALNGE